MSTVVPLLAIGLVVVTLLVGWLLHRKDWLIIERRHRFGLAVVILQAVISLALTISSTKLHTFDKATLVVLLVVEGF